MLLALSINQGAISVWSFTILFRLPPVFPGPFFLCCHYLRQPKIYQYGLPFLEVNFGQVYKIIALEIRLRHCSNHWSSLQPNPERIQSLFVEGCQCSRQSRSQTSMYPRHCSDLVVQMQWRHVIHSPNHKVAVICLILKLANAYL